MLDLYSKHFSSCLFYISSTEIVIVDVLRWVGNVLQIQENKARNTCSSLNYMDSFTTMT